MWDGDDGEDKGATPKQRLMHWIQSKVPDLPITNFTSDWNDGRAVGALVDAVAPGLCPDWQDWNPKDAVQNASEAMGLADDWLNIPQVRYNTCWFALNLLELHLRSIFPYVINWTFNAMDLYIFNIIERDIIFSYAELKKKYNKHYLNSFLILFLNYSCWFYYSWLNPRRW